MADAVVVYEILKRDDGSVSGVGNSLECSKAEADKLVDAGTHKYLSVPLGLEKPKKAKKSGSGDEVE